MRWLKPRAEPHGEYGSHADVVLQRTEPRKLSMAAPSSCKMSPACHKPSKDVVCIFVVIMSVQNRCTLAA